MQTYFNLNRLKGAASIAAMSMLGLAAITLPQQATAQTISLVHDFTDGTLGREPDGGLVLAADGNFYGTTFYGGDSDFGTAFQLTPQGQHTVIYKFGQTLNDGRYPVCSLVQGPDGALYGTTSNGGVNDCGTVFKITVSGSPATATLTTLHNFDFTHGANPNASLIFGSDGNLYGTTLVGNGLDGGVAFKLTTAGAYTVIRYFTSDITGLNPRCTLTQGPDGTLYGTTTGGGNNGYGTVFAITTAGAVKWTKAFTYQQAASPYEGVVFGPDGDLYGTSYSGAIGYGGIYKVTTAGVVSNVYGFDGSSGYTPYSQMTLGPDGNLYGATYYGGPTGSGTIFRIDGGGFKFLHVFNGTYGAHVDRNLIFGKDGNIYGLASAGGQYGNGTAFKLDVDIPTIASFTPTAGPLNTYVTITGTNYLTATGVTINGAAATYTIVNDTQIKAKVPAGATPTGLITVTTPAATTTSTQVFTLTNGAAPTITSLSPASAKVGAVIAIAGTGFTGATAVKFHGLAAAAYTVVNANKITATVPMGATNGTVTVTTPSGTATSATSFTVLPSAPTINVMSPSSAKAGTLITLAGAGFTGASTVRFTNNIVATFTVINDTKLTTTVPATAVTGPITVVTPAGAGVSAANFTVLPSPPSITNFSPSSGPVGTVVTVAGSNFTGLTGVKVNNYAAPNFTVVNASKFTFTIPAGATTGKIAATTAAGTATTGSSFTVLP